MKMVNTVWRHMLLLAGYFPGPRDEKGSVWSRSSLDKKPQLSRAIATRIRQEIECPQVGCEAPKRQICPALERLRRPRPATRARNGLWPQNHLDSGPSFMYCPRNLVGRPACLRFLTVTWGAGVLSPEGCVRGEGAWCPAGAVGAATTVFAAASTRAAPWSSQVLGQSGQGQSPPPPHSSLRSSPLASVCP